MRTKQWMCLSAGLLALMLVACSKDEIKDCDADTDCDTAELCHPNVKVCVKKCTGSGDCPDSAKSCGKISTSDDRMICQCITDELCNDRKPDGDLVCHKTHKVCVPKSTETDGSPAVTSGGTCDASKPQPDVCKYGLFCSSDNKCTAPPSSSACSSKFPENLGWDPSTPTGPIIYSVESKIVNKIWCVAGTTTPTLVVTVKAYSTDSLLKRGSSVPFMLYRPDGAKIDLAIGNQINNAGWVNDGDNHATVEFNLCGYNLPYVGGIVFDKGNTACVIHN
jgi:hypothetical protein